MPKVYSHSYSTELDKTLGRLFELAEGDELKRIEAGLEDGSLSEEEFSELIPDGLVLAFVFLSNEATFQFSLRGADKEQVDRLTKAKKLIDSRFGAILRHPRTVKRFERLGDNVSGSHSQEDRDPVVTSTEESDRSIHGISNLKMWVGKPPDLVPAIRLKFLDRAENVLLDSMLDWGSSLFVAEATLGILVDHLEAGQRLVEAGQVSVMDDPKLARDIVEIEKHLSRIKHLAPMYGIELTSSPSSRSDHKPESRSGSKKSK